MTIRLLALLSLLSPAVGHATPTGAPLSSFPVVPCRILDTRVALGPLAGQAAMDVHVRGSQLLASEGAGRADCDVPPEAEAVMVNVTVIQPTTGGYLKVNGTGSVGGPHGVYSRLTYRALENDANEIQVDLCNVFLYPTPHEPCGFDGARYLDFQVLNGGAAGSSLHLVIDVVGYLANATP